MRIPFILRERKDLNHLQHNFISLFASVEELLSHIKHVANVQKMEALAPMETLTCTKAGKLHAGQPWDVWGRGCNRAGGEQR